MALEKLNKSFLATLIYPAMMSGCAANLTPLATSTTTTSAYTTQASVAASLTRSLVHFNYVDFYTLTSPNPSTQCAGDANTFYDPINSTTLSDGTLGPTKLDQSLIDPTTTIRPSFIKNISVDVTDSNSNSTSNLAFACSYSGTTAPPASHCATFDYGAVGGISSTLGGSMLLFGGLTSQNYTGIQNYYVPQHSLAVNCGPVSSTAALTTPIGVNQCNPSFYALGVNSLSPSVLQSTTSASLAPGLTSATSAISIWGNLNANTTTTTSPPGKIGSSAAYDSVLQKLLIFGGSAPLSVLTPAGQGSATYDSWVFDVPTQTWKSYTSNITVDTSIQRTYDFPSSSLPVSSTSGSQTQLSKLSGGRSIFGYAAVPGMAISQLSSSGAIFAQSYPSGDAPIDTTDRIITLGGNGNNCNTIGCTDTHSFNPTFAPEYFDTLGVAQPANTTSDAFPAQWIDSYHSQTLSNLLSASQYTPSGFPAVNPSVTSVGTLSSVNFGMVALRNNNPVSPGATGAGYLLVAGGFSGYTNTAANINSPYGSCTTLANCGGMELFLKWFRNDGTNTWSQANERTTSNFTEITNQKDLVGSENTPGRWTKIPSNTPVGDTTPFYGGASLLKGINITSTTTDLSKNEVVFFGGSDCKQYLTDSTACASATWPVSYNAGAYWLFTNDPASQFNPTTTNYPSTLTMSGSGAGIVPPINAGMASARGLDLAGNPLIVAWGGMTSATVLDTTGNIYYLYNNNTSGSSVPTWATYTVPAGLGPTPVANASLVYSHVTNKYYLFGGYSPSGGTQATTWELTLSAPAGGGGSASCGTQGNCVFSWRALTSAAGQTCYPNCPSARRSHRMVEANYNNLDPSTEPGCANSAQPCSFGMFMEGGTPDGSTIFNDRWTFDPSANSGAGHWQLLGELPPRTLAAMANVDYTLPATGGVAHRAILFGGETGLQSPQGATGVGSSGYFVPPTLGDTWMYDYDKNQWNKINLYGIRYSTAAVPNLQTLSEVNARSASLVTNPNTTLFSPPPLSGATMVTRTLSKAKHLAADKPNNLAIPEIYLFGGRRKDGSYQTLNQIFKFCAGSTGEKPYPSALNGTPVPLPDDASCDAFDATLNPNSPSPSSGYVGRWMVKNPLPSPSIPTFVPNRVGSFMGGATYDSLHDLILLYGGLSPNPLECTSCNTPTAVTDISKRTTDSTGEVLEYTPASSVSSTDPNLINGSYNIISSCSESPSVPKGRYGHTVAYDNFNQALLVVGGYDNTGSLLTQTVTYSDGRTYSVPEVWLGYRIDTALPNGIPSKNIPPIGESTVCYYWKPITLFGNSIDSTTQAPPMTGLAMATSVFLPSTGYNSGYYTTNDNSCINAGPIASPDVTISKLLAGGAYIDIDRSQLGVNENLILNLTFIPLGANNTGPDQNLLSSSSAAIFKIHLIKTGQSGDVIRQQHQPRYLIYSSTDQFPQVAQDVAVVAPPNGQARQEQVYLPLATDPGIDRIRIERYSGNAILIDASVYRLGVNTN